MKMTKILVAGIAAAVLASGQTGAQTCKDNILASAPDNRYIDHQDGTVTDKTTGLMWKQCAEGLSGQGCKNGQVENVTWQGAEKRVHDLNAGKGFAKHADWRLPTAKELATLLERSCKSPAINLTLFPATPATRFWSSSPNAAAADYVWFVNFDNGKTYSYGRLNLTAVRLVRGGK